MDQITWKQEYAVGNDLIDQQHQNLFRIVNRLCSDLSKDEFQSELMNLYKHTREHFADEEKMMKDANYLYYKEHRDSHDRLLSELNSHVEIVTRDPGQLQLIQDFLLGWAKYHVLDQDQALAHYVEKNYG